MGRWEGRRKDGHGMDRDQPDNQLKHSSQPDNPLDRLDRREQKARQVTQSINHTNIIHCWHLAYLKQASFQNTTGGVYTHLREHHSRSSWRHLRSGHPRNQPHSIMAHPISPSNQSTSPHRHKSLPRARIAPRHMTQFSSRRRRRTQTPRSLPRVTFQIPQVCFRRGHHRWRERSASLQTTFLPSPAPRHVTPPFLSRAQPPPRLLER